MQSPCWRLEDAGRHLDSKHAGNIPLLSLAPQIHRSKLSRPDVRFCTLCRCCYPSTKSGSWCFCRRGNSTALPPFQPSSSRSPRLLFRAPSFPILIINPITCTLCFSQRCHRHRHRHHHRQLVQARLYPSLRISSPRGNRPSTSLSH